MIGVHSYVHQVWQPPHMRGSSCWIVQMELPIHNILKSGIITCSIKTKLVSISSPYMETTTLRTRFWFFRTLQSNLRPTTSVLAAIGNRSCLSTSVCWVIGVSSQKNKNRRSSQCLVNPSIIPCLTFLTNESTEEVPS